MYNHILNERAIRQHHQELIREAQAIHLAQTVQAHNQPVSQRIVTPIRRAAYLVAALIR